MSASLHIAEPRSASQQLVSLAIASQPSSESPIANCQFRDGLWLYGNLKLLESSVACIDRAFGPDSHHPKTLVDIEREVEELVLNGKTLVCGIHSAAHQRTAIVPLRWGAPRIVVFSGGFQHHLGDDLTDEPFQAARLWRYAWDPTTDLAVSRRAPDKKPTFARHNPTVDRLIARIASNEWKRDSLQGDLLSAVLTGAL